MLSAGHPGALCLGPCSLDTPGKSETGRFFSRPLLRSLPSHPFLQEDLYDLPSCTGHMPTLPLLFSEFPSEVLLIVTTWGHVVETHPYHHYDAGIVWHKASPKEGCLEEWLPCLHLTAQKIKTRRGVVTCPTQEPLI